MYCTWFCYAALQLNPHADSARVVAEWYHTEPGCLEGWVQHQLHLGVGITVPLEQVHALTVSVIFKVRHPLPPVLDTVVLRKLLAETIGKPALCNHSLE